MIFFRIDQRIFKSIGRILNMKKISFFAVILFLFTAIAYQNCSHRSSSGGSSDGDEPVRVGNGDGVELVVDFKKGGYILYEIRLSDLDNQSPTEPGDIVSSNSVSLKLGQYFLESRLYRDDNFGSSSDLCSKSAFPHCLYVREHEENQDVSDYRFVHSPLKCHSQHRLSQNETISLFNYARSIRYSVIAEGGTNQPTDNECRLSTLSFKNPTESLSIVLDYELYRDSVCLPSQTKYASSGSVSELKGFFEKKTSELTLKRDDEEGFCNNYSSYSTSTTDWNYHSDDGYSRDQSFTKAEYNKRDMTVSLRWKEDVADSQIQCANVFLQADELAVFFPEGGLEYKFYYVDDDGDGLITSVIDAANQYIIYEDPFDNGNKWKFYGKENYAKSGGALLQNSQMESIENTIEGLISRAKSQNLLIDCPET